MREFSRIVFWCDAEAYLVDGSVLEVLVIGPEHYRDVLVFQCSDGLEFFIDVFVIIGEVCAYLELLLGLFAEVSECDDVPMVEHPREWGCEEALACFEFPWFVVHVVAGAADE